MDNPLKPNTPYPGQFYHSGGKTSSESQAGKGATNNQSSSSSPEGSKNTKGSDPILSLPKGGGAIKGIGEKFQANPVTGTGSLSIPLPISPGRGEFTPQLALSYDSGIGNGPFGLGWSIGLPSISRKTDKGLPKYQDSGTQNDDAAGGESDVFILSGAEDLVPVLDEVGGVWVRKQSEDATQTYLIYPYRPRIEGLFAKIERWEDKTTHISHWRATTKDNVTTIYGYSQQSTIVDPEKPTHVFQWMIERTLDHKGNSIHYTYKRENNENVAGSIYETPRLAAGTAFTNLYLKMVQYGTASPVTSLTDQYPADNHFTLVFDYGEHTGEPPSFTGSAMWSARMDPFSNHRGGFEIRTYRLCNRILMFHQFTELGNDPCLVKMAKLTYENRPELTLLKSIKVSGYDDTQTKKSYPSVEFSYTEAIVGEQVYKMDPTGLQNFTNGGNGESFQWMDLHGEGLSGILIQNSQAWYYKPNLGDKRYYEPPQSPALNTGPKSSLGGMMMTHDKPSLAVTGDNRQQLGDIDGNGQVDLRILSPGVSGYYEIEKDNCWQTFHPFKSIPNIDLNDPNLRMIDLTGDGHADILITGDRCFTSYYSLAKQGFAPALRLSKAIDEEQGPAVVFSDTTQSIYLADMSGDGLTDIVRIRNGSVDYWPNLGYGNFASKVSMSNAPRYESNDRFEQSRIRLADVDGTGTTDIIYLATEGIKYWKNQAGNSWSDVCQINHFPAYNKLLNISVMDLMGNGTSCLVAASTSPASGPSRVQYLELTGGKKPFLLNEMKNNFGAITRLGYAPSTKFYLRDKMAGKPWITKLPFPVHVVERVETYDAPTDSRFVTRYAYHHGYFDGIEREFRGFGMVEQWDTENYDTYINGVLFHTASNEEDEESNTPPLYTKTWFHTGFYTEGQKISAHFASEYFQGDNQAWLLDDTLLPAGLASKEIKEACRALKGSILRQEIYANDGTASAGIPYTVSERSYSIRKIQPFEMNRHAVFHVIESETLTYNYERIVNDPRIAHKLVLDTDPFGNPTDVATVAYARRSYPSSYSEQQGKCVIRFDHFEYIDSSSATAFYRHGDKKRDTSWELHNYSFSGKCTKNDLLTAISGATRIANLANPGVILSLRLLADIKYFYTAENGTGSLSYGQMPSHGLISHTQTLTFTAEAIAAMIHENTDGLENTLLPTDFSAILASNHYVSETYAGFNTPATGYWKNSEKKNYDGNHFWLLNEILNPVNFSAGSTGKTTITYDSFYVLPVTVTNELGETVTALNDYIQVKPKRITDENGNSREVFYDGLGMILTLSVFGKNGEGDTGSYSSLYFNYFVNNWHTNSLPVYVHIMAIKEHRGSEYLHSYTYSDGLGREIQTKVQAEDGKAWRLNGTTPEEIDSTDRWVSTGRKIYNNKGLVVKQYEPWFSTTYAYENEDELTTLNRVKIVMRYDPPGRLIRTDFPDGTFSKVVFDAWQQENWDRNDTVLDSHWYTGNGSPDPTDPEPTLDIMERAAWLAAQHSGTPQVIDLDQLGRPFCITDDNSNYHTNTIVKYTTLKQLDMAGNELRVTDAKSRVMTRNIFDMTGLLLFTVNIDSGRRWAFYDVASKPVLRWDNLSNEIQNNYDTMQRPTETRLKENGSATQQLVEIVEYGSGTGDYNNNLLGKPKSISDQCGITEYTLFDFKGNVLSLNKQLCETFSATINWSVPQTMEADIFAETMSYDALNRLTQHTKPDTTVETYGYNKAGLPETVSARIRGSVTTTNFVTNIDYNEKGQRTAVLFGNNSKTGYTYDIDTFRLTRLLTTRNTGADILQDIHYYYDPEGNIVQQVDNAVQTIYFNNAVIAPVGKYTYDALYRLTKTTGRELTSLGMATDADFVNNIPVPKGGNNAMQNYTQLYSYDELGNILAMQSISNTPWTRNYYYTTGNTNNYLVTHDNLNYYTYDKHGNMLSMPSLTAMAWDFADRMKSSVKGGFTTWYCYDMNGNRTRKITDKGTFVEERIYLNGYEVYRKITSGTITFERQTLHIDDDKKRVALVETKTIDTPPPTITSVIRYQYDNHLGSACLELDATALANIISYEEYHPFGTTSYRSGSSEAEVSLKRYKYVGKERDEETGLYYYGARYYAAWIARFVSVDPLQDKYPHYTPYQYAGNKPISYFDLDGMEEKKQNENIIDVKDNAKSDYNDAMKNKKFSGIIDTIKTTKFKDEQGEQHDVIIHFTTNLKDIKDLLGDKKLDPGGTITASGLNKEGKFDAWVFWEKPIENELGTSGIYEETYHLKDALEAKEMKFAKSTGIDGKWGLKGRDIYEETRAKLWVIENIKDVKRTYKCGDDVYKLTHYGQVMEYKGNENLLADNLRKGIDPKPPIDRFTGDKINRPNPLPYIPMGFTGKGYNEFSPIKQYP
ncbi:MAG: hypothetical protein M0P47_11185 [Bacteroidales bacterium]|nr:hypothetical protein [Bacteroidales bacterium]